MNPRPLTQAVEEAVVESVSSLETKSDMVTRKVITISRFVPSARPAV